MSQLLAEKLPHSISYEAYLTLMNNLREEGKTTGPNQSEDMVHYTQLNQKRMTRIHKKYQPGERLLAQVQKINKDYLWLVITEAWCGDAAQVMPILGEIAAQSPHLEMRVILRDEHLDLMDAYLTDGSRSIPKLICIEKETGQEVGVWGPRPAEAQQLVMDFKAHPETSYKVFAGQLQQWYNKDKGQKIEAELSAFIAEWAT